MVLLTAKKPKQEITINKEVIQEYKNVHKERNGKIIPGKYSGKFYVNPFMEKTLISIKNNHELKKINPKERYEEGLYDKTNIFEVAGQILFLQKSKNIYYTDNWKMAVMKMFDYRSRFKPKENVIDFNKDWLDTFITTIKEQGYSCGHAHKFNPFNYDPDIFTKTGTKKYVDTSLEKFIKNCKEVFGYLMKKQILPFFDIDEILYTDYGLLNTGKKKGKDEGKKKDFLLYKEEIDKLLYYNDFKDDIFTTSDGKKINYKKQELEKGRDLFILQFFFGGLRANELYRDIQILNDEKGLKKVHYYVSKDGEGTNENPICSYSDIVLKKYNYDVKSVLIEYSKYCQILKLIGRQVFDRVIIYNEQIDGIKSKIRVNIKDELESHFARRTFKQFLKERKKSQEERNEFTGNRNNSVDSLHYTTYTIAMKREVMDTIKPEIVEPFTEKVV